MAGITEFRQFKSIVVYGNFVRIEDFGGLGILLQAGNYSDVKKLNLVLNDTVSSARVMVG